MSKENINLPKTAFSMKANLPTREPDIINYWKKIELYKKLRAAKKGKEKCMKYFNSTLVAKYLLEKTFGIKTHNKYIWDNK